MKRRVLNLRAFPSLVIVLELRPLCSTGVTRLPRSYGPLRHPSQPSLVLAGCWLGALTSHRVGFPVLPQVSVARMSSPIPRRYGRSALFVRFLRPVSLPRVSIGSAFALPFSRLARCSLILGPARSLTRLHEPLTSGASPAAVTSDTRPDCFRRNESCRVGFSLPRESCSVFTAH